MSVGDSPRADASVLRQHTLAEPVELSGVGLHTAAESTVVLRPAPAGHGRRFVRADLPGAPELTPADVDTGGPPRRISLARAGASVETIEHLVAALVGLGVDNVVCEFHAPEPPAGDGSAMLFAEAIERAGVVAQEAAREAFVIEEPIAVEADGASLVALPGRPGSPAEALTHVGYHLAYPDSPLASGSVECALTREDFLKDLAPARTFCMAGDVERLLAQGLGKGASYANTLVIDGERVVENELRFPDEPVRHKALDLVGDLGLLGAPLVGRIVGFRSGHGLNLRLVREVARSSPRRGLDSLFPEPVMGMAGIEGVLPHRYPFLLVDRVLELVPEERIVAVKNVSRNEQYFSGHFPGLPVMPGVLEIEAIAQAAGLLLSRYLRDGENPATLAALDRVKLRRPVRPGDRLLLTVELSKARHGLAVCRGKATVAGKVTAEATLRFPFVGDGSAPKSA